jgi:hypothetical protein
MILSSTRPANHARVESAGDSAGQLLNRVFERHKIQRQRLRGEWRDAQGTADLALPDADVGEAVQGHVHEPGTRHERLG